VAVCCCLRLGLLFCSLLLLLLRTFQSVMMLIEVTRNKGMRLQRQNALLIQGLLYQEAISKVCLLKTEIQNVDFFVHTVRSYEFLSYQPFIVVERTMMAVTGWSEFHSYI
jgi:hypothetical protein